MGRDNGEYKQDNEQYEGSMKYSNIRGKQENPRDKKNKLEVKSKDNNS
jgi:hypothetical protein